MRLSNIFNLGVKELRSLVRDRIMLVLIVYAFTGAIYTAASTIPETLNKASIAHRRRGPLGAVHAHRRRLLSALFQYRRG